MSTPTTESATTTESIMLRLRRETRTHHERAEQHPFQQALVHGTLPREAYARYLAQLHIVHSAMESALAACAAREDRLRAIVSEDQFMSGFAGEDAQFFGVNPAEARALPGSQGMLERIAWFKDCTPVGLLGLHYVTLGSSNGGKFIARAVRKSYRLSDSGVRYLDPWGERQPAIWGAFKERMNAASFLPAENDTIVTAAGEMFDAIGHIGGDCL